MSNPTANQTRLPPEQEWIRAKCFHPSGAFFEFANEEVEQSIPERFEKIARLHPARLAIKTDKHKFTYYELNKTTNRIARAILTQPGATEEPIALLFEHGAFVIAAILGILKTGRIYVPLDPALPSARLAEMLEDSRAKLLLTNTQNFSRAQGLSQQGQQILNCDDIDAAVGDGNLNQPLFSETNAVILYTSGSTGKPKGVLHNQRNILVETRNYTNDIQICPEDRLSLCQSCSFANSIRNVYGALLNGAALFPYDLAAEGIPSLVEWLIANRITIFHTLESIVRRMRETIEPGTAFPALRLLRFGGEPSGGEEVKYFQLHFAPQCVLMNVIGLTETFSIRRCFVTEEFCPGDTKVPLGYGVPGKDVLLLDEAGQEVSAGQIGEIAVRSRDIALGYWQRPDLTRAAFLPGPDGGENRVYLTGDLGIVRPDGCLMHMGRKDFQVKIRGNRVETTAIETAILKLSSVQAAIVHPQADGTGEPRLVAYVVPAAGQTSTVGEIRRALTPALPDYMIPSAVVFLDALPVVPNGRIDRRALPSLTRARPILEASYVAPRTSIEHELASIWAEFLNVEQIGIDDNFLELGGHSLLAARILSRIFEKYHVRLPVRSLFEAPTVASLAKLIETIGWNSQASQSAGPGREEGEV